MVHDKGIIYGIFRQDENKLAIHNPMFETYLYTYFVGMREVSQEVFNVPLDNVMELYNKEGLSSLPI